MWLTPTSRKSTRTTRKAPPDPVPALRVKNAEGLLLHASGGGPKSRGMNKRCYYETLECQKGATGDILKSAYRKLAMKFHPDKNPGDHTAEVKFKEISEAYDVLKDDQKRAAYDRFGHAAFEAGMGAARRARRQSVRRFRRQLRRCVRGYLRPDDGRRAAASGRIAARTCATIWKSAWKRPSPAAPPRSKCPPGGLRDLRRLGRGSRATAPRPVPPAPATARCAPPRASSPSSAPARPAAAAARSSAIPARPAAARAWCRRSAP